MKYDEENKFNDFLYEMLKNDVEPDCEDYYLAEIESKANDYDKLQNQFKSLKGTVKKIIYKSNNRHYELKRKIAKIEKLQKENTELKQIISSIEEYCNENYKEACNYYDAWQFKLSGNGKDADIAYEKRELLGEILEILRGNNNVKN